MNNADETLDTVGKRIKYLRKQAGFSQDDLGERIGATRQSISKWESDAAKPRVENLVELSKTLGVELSYFDISDIADIPESSAAADETAATSAPQTAVYAKRNGKAKWLAASIVIGILFVAVALATVCVGFISLTDNTGVQTITTAGIDASVFYVFVAACAILSIAEAALIAVTVKKYKCKQKST